MTTSASLVTRRDERYKLRPGVSFVDFPEGRLGLLRSPDAAEPLLEVAARRVRGHDDD